MAVRATAGYGEVDPIVFMIHILATEGARIAGVGRVAAAVQIGMTINAAARHRQTACARRIAIRAIDPWKIAAMVGRLMTLLTQERRAQLQQVSGGRTVRVMT